MLQRRTRNHTQREEGTCILTCKWFKSASSVGSRVNRDSAREEDAPVVSIMNQVMISARTAPVTLFARCAGISLVSFFSTTRMQIQEDHVRTDSSTNICN